MAIVNPYDDLSVDVVNENDSINPPMEFVFYPDDEGLRILGSTGEVLTRVDLNLAYSSEKFLNLDILLMHVADKAGDLESLNIDDESISCDTAEGILEFDILAGILHSELKELDNFMLSLQEEIMDASDRISSYEHLKAAFSEMEQNLHDSEESLKQLQDQVAEMRLQSTKFQSTIAFGLASWNSGISEISNLSSIPNKMKMQTTEQQRHILKMLEKSLARELDLEKWLSESRHNEEELKLKLYCAEQEMDESIDLILERVFKAESFAEVLKAIAEELTEKLQTARSYLDSSIKPENEMKASLQENIDNFSAQKTDLDNLKSNRNEAEEDFANSEATTLTQKLTESDIQLQEPRASVQASQSQHNMLDSKIIDLEKLVKDLRENVLKMESRAESAETECKLLAEANSKLEEELSSVINKETEKMSSLEKQLGQSEAQLQQARALIEANQESQNRLQSTLSDKELLIEDLKEKVQKAEDHAKTAEAKCILLSKVNLEHKEELDFLQGRVECLEMSLQQAHDMKAAVSKDIGMRTKMISDLLVKLAMERERLHSKISSLTKENNILEEKLLETRNGSSVTISLNGNSSNKQSIFLKKDSTTARSPNSFEELAPKCTTTCLQAGSTISGIASKLGLTRAIEARWLSSKYVFMAVLILLISMAVVYLFPQESF